MNIQSIARTARTNRRVRKPSQWPLPLPGQNTGGEIDPSAELAKGPIAVGICFTVFIHILLFLILPSHFSPSAVIMPKKALEVEILPSEQEDLFIETNAAAPDEVPEQPTPFFSSQNQQAAQEKPLLDAMDLLPTELKGEINAHKIVPSNAELTPPPMPVEMAETPSEQQTAAVDNQAQDTPPLKDDDTGNFTKKPQPLKPMARPAPTTPRPKVSMTGVQGPIKNFQGGTNRMGARAVDARFTQYGDYLQRLIEAIGTQWTLMCRESSRMLPDRGTYAMISFIINEQGQVVQLNIDQSTTSGMALNLCKDAILSRAPFGNWSEDMVKTLGDAQMIKIHFTY